MLTGKERWEVQALLFLSSLHGPVVLCSYQESLPSMILCLGFVSISSLPPFVLTLDNSCFNLPWNSALFLCTARACVLSCFSCVRLCVALWTPGKNPGEGCCALLQGTFLTHGLNPRLLRLTCIGRWILYHSHHLGKPIHCPQLSKEIID